MITRVLSFSFEDCIYNDNYKPTPMEYTKDPEGTYNKILNANKHFLDVLKQENEEGKFSEVCVFIGSIPKPNFSDNDTNTIPLYPPYFCIIERISEYLGSKLNPFLFPDIGFFDDRHWESGTYFKYAREYQKSLEQEKWDKVEAAYAYAALRDGIWDHTKVSLIYAQVHIIANEKPNEEIVFDFCSGCRNVNEDIGHYINRYCGSGKDPRCLETISALREDKIDTINDINTFYSKYSYLLPENVTLRLYRYSGEERFLITEIPGAGMIDKNYRQTVQDLVKQSMLNEKHCWVAKYADPSLLKNRKALCVDASDKVSVIPQSIFTTQHGNPREIHASSFEVKEASEEDQMINEIDDTVTICPCRIS